MVHPDIPAEKRVLPTMVQVIFPGRDGHQVWAVDANLADPSMDDANLKDFIQTIKDHDLHGWDDGTIHAPEDPRHISGFLTEFKWLSITQGHNYKELCQLVETPTKSSPALLPLKKKLDTYFSHIRPIIQGMSPLVLRWIHTSEGYYGFHLLYRFMLTVFVREIHHRPFGFLQNQSSSTRYEHYALQLICFCIHYITTSNPPIPVTFTHEQSANTHKLLQAIQSSIPLTDETWDSHIHTLLSSLFYHKHPAVIRNSDKDPIQMCLILMNMDPKTGNFMGPDIIAGRMSGLMHIMRLVAVKEIRRLADEEPIVDDADYKYVFMSPSNRTLLIFYSI